MYAKNKGNTKEKKKKEDKKQKGGKEKCIFD